MIHKECRCYVDNVLRRWRQFADKSATIFLDIQSCARVSNDYTHALQAGNIC